MTFLKRNILSIPKFFKRSARLFFVALLSPKKDTEDLRRREFILNIILVASIIFLFLLDFFVFYHSLTQGENYPGISFAQFSIIPLFFVLLLFLSRKGKPILAAYLLIAAYLAAIFFGAIQWGVDLQPVILSFALIIVISSILISTRFAFLVTTFICLMIIPLWYLQVNHYVDVQWYWKQKPQSTDVLVFSSILFLIMTVSWLSNREIERSLRRARSSEAALKDERDKLEITVQERTRELQQAQAEKISQLYRFAEFGRLSSGLFHDLMNPLTSISLYLEQLNKTNPGIFDETQGYLHKAFAASKRIEQFTQAVRKQLQHRQSNEQFSMSEGIKHAIELLAHKAWKDKVKLSFEPLADVEAYSNPLKFHQVMVNLISNAIDSYDSIENKTADDRTVAVTLNAEGDLVKISITDHGSGIPSEHLAKIFDPFFTTKTVDKGTGIGLATTKQIIERDMRGSIKIITEEGKGTSFVILIPLDSIKSTAHGSAV